MKTRQWIVNVLMVATCAIGVVCVTAGRVQAGTVALTSVNQLDLTNVVKAYDFTFSASNGVFDIGGVTFTRHFWGASNPHTFDDLTLSGHLLNDNQQSLAPAIALGGTAQDRANLNALLGCWNIGSQDAPPMDLSIAVPNGAYKVQFIVGVHPAGNRYNELFDTNAGTPGVSLGYFSGAGNWLITGTVSVSDGTLNLRLADYVPGTGGDDRRIISGLIINTDVAPPSVGGTVAVKTVVLEVTGFVGYKQWQASANGGTWSNLTGQTASTLDVTALYTNTPWFRVKATSGTNEPAYSTTMCVTSQMTAQGTLIMFL